MRVRPMTARRRTVAALGAFLLLATSACGARWNEEQRAAVLQAGSASAAAGSGTRATGGAGNATSAGSDGTTATGGTGAATGTQGGSTGSGAGDGATSGASGPLPCSAPSDAPGVTDDTITIGTISTQSGAVPGLGASALAAVQAYIAYRNSTGGVCGRQLDLRSADDGMDNGRHRALVAEMSPHVLGLAGGVGGGDAGSAEIVVAENMPVVNTPISEVFQNAATVFDVNPPFADVNVAPAKFRWLYEQGVRTAAVIYPNIDQTRSEVLGKQKPQMEAAGIQVVLDQPVPLSTLSWDSTARAVANSGADYMFFASDPSQSAALAQAINDAGADLMFEEYLTTYGSSFIDLAGSAAEGTSNWIRTLPNEDGGANAEQAAFLEWMDQAAPGVVRDTFAADSWSSAKAFFDAVEAIPGPITRDALIATLQTLTNYDAGGFIGNINLGGKLNNGCVVAMVVEGGEWRRLTPSQGFLC